MLFLLRFIKGYLRVRFYGGNIEKFFNLSAKNGIAVWGLCRSQGGIECYLSVSNFKKLRVILRKSHIRAKILYKKGLPFFMAKNRKRWGVTVGLVLFFAALKLLSCFVWVIEVEGNETVPDEDIISACEEIGIKEGIFSNSIEPKIARQRLLLCIDSLSWASLVVEGSRLTVDVSETKEAEISPPCNLRAATDGVIKKIDISAGECLVKVGQTVKEGDILVSGVTEKAGVTNFVAAAGSITAETVREMTFKTNFLVEEKFITGETAKRTVLEFFTLKIPLYLGRQTGEYDSILTKERVTFLESELPITLYTREFFFYEVMQKSLSNQEAVDDLENQLEEALIDLEIENYTVEKRNYSETDKEITMTVLIKAEENIALKDIILFDRNEENSTE